MSTGAEFRQYILQTHNSIKFFKSNAGFEVEPLTSLWLRQWGQK